MEDWTLADAQCLDPLKWAKKFGPESAPRLAEDLIDAVGNENSKHLFCIGNGFSKYSVMYQIKHQYKCYQLESLPDGN